MLGFLGRLFRGRKPEATGGVDDGQGRGVPEARDAVAFDSGDSGGGPGDGGVPGVAAHVPLSGDVRVVMDYQPAVRIRHGG